MNKKEKIEIALNLSILMQSVLDKNLNSEEVANHTITYCAEFLKKFPEIKDLVEEMICDDWDTNIAWIDWERTMING